MTNKSKPVLDITAPLFTINEVASAAELDPAMVHLWLKRGVLKASRVEELAVRRRAMFSVEAVFRAKLARVLSGTLGIGPFDVSEADKTKKIASTAALRSIAGPDTRDARPTGHVIKSLTGVITDQSWMWAIARSVEQDKPLPLLGGISRAGDCWQFLIDLDANKLADRFGPDTAYGVIPIGTLFARVYRQCKTIYEGGTTVKPRK